jgi:hypothetical protein
MQDLASELRRTSLPRTPVNRTSSPLLVDKRGSFGVLKPVVEQRRNRLQMSEQARKVKKHIPEWAEGLYYNSGLITEVLVYLEGEAYYAAVLAPALEVDGLVVVVLETLKMVIEEESENSTQ